MDDVYVYQHHHLMESVLRVFTGAAFGRNKVKTCPGHVEGVRDVFQLV